MGCRQDPLNSGPQLRECRLRVPRDSVASWAVFRPFRQANRIPQIDQIAESQTGYERQLNP